MAKTSEIKQILKLKHQQKKEELSLRNKDKKDQDQRRLDYIKFLYKLKTDHEQQKHNNLKEKILLVRK